MNSTSEVAVPLPLPQSLVANPLLATWVRFDTATRVVEVRVGKVEIGQGIGTALLQIAADALRVTPARIRLVAGRTDCTPDELWTSASLSVEVSGAALNRVCTEVRTLFAQRAAAGLALPEQRLQLLDGVFSGEDAADGLSYWDLAGQVPLDRPYAGLQPFMPAGTTPSAWVGTPLPRVDLERKLRGQGFVHDLRVDGMRHACVLRPPRASCALASIDGDAIRRMPGVESLVVDGSFVALCGSDEHAIRLAQTRARAHVVWSDGPPLPGAPDDLERFLRGLRSEPRRIVEPGVAALPDDPTAQRVRSTYLRPYLAHASIGTCCALACPSPDGMTIHSHSQGVFPLRDAIARVLALPAAAVTVIHADGAGCYGHNGADDVALEAALVARAVGRPVRIAWSREEELGLAPFGPAMLVDIDAGITAEGRITHWHQAVTSTTHLVRPGWGSGVNLLAAAQLAEPHAPSVIADPPQSPFGGGGDRNAIPLYRFGQADGVCSVDYRFSPETPLRSSALRSLGAHANVFAIESMLDELAATVGIDPLALRLLHLDDPRARAVLQTAADMAGWGHHLAGQGDRGWGLGFARYKNRAAYFAAVVELEITHVIRVVRVHAAVDCGRAVNPDGVRNQIEGGIVQAVSWALKEQVRWSRAGVHAATWEDYPVLRFDEVPSLAIHILARPDSPPLGVGECTMGPVAAAIANALAHALDVRVREMPLTPERVASC